MMRSILLTGFICAFLTSCSNDDDNNSGQEFTIVGEWEITQRFINNQEQQLGECEPFTIYRYNSDGTYYERAYAADLNSPCLQNPFIEFNGNWSNSGSTYTISFTGPNTADIFDVQFISQNSFSSEFDVVDNSGTIRVREIFQRN